MGWRKLPPWLMWWLVLALLYLLAGLMVFGLGIEHPPAAPTRTPTVVEQRPRTRRGGPHRRQADCSRKG